MKYQPGTMKKHEINLEPWETMKTNLDPWKTMETDLEPWKTNLEPWKTMKTNLEPWKPTWNHEKLTWNLQGGYGWLQVVVVDSKEEVIIFRDRRTNRQTEPSYYI